MYVDLSIIFYVLPTLLDILKNEMPAITFMWLVWSAEWPMDWSINICNKFSRDAAAAVRRLPFKQQGYRRTWICSLTLSIAGLYELGQVP